MNTKLLALVTLLGGCAGAADDAGSSGAGLGGFVPIPIGPKLTVDSFEPHTALEGRNSFVHFTLTNAGMVTRTGRVGALITPVVGKPYEAQFSWRVDALPRGAAVSGVVAFDAPEAASQANDLLLFFEDAATKAHVLEVHRAFDVARRFTFEVERVFASQIRSPHADTDWAALAVHNPNGPDPIPDTGFLGNVSSGRINSFRLQGTGAIDAIPDVDNVLLGSIVVNFGVGAPDAQLLQNMATDVLIGQSFTLSNFGHGTCDGVVALAPQTIGARQLFDLTGGPGGNAIGDPTANGIGSLPAYDYADSAAPYGCDDARYRVTLAAVSRTRRFDREIVVFPPVVALRAGVSQQFTVENGTPVDWTIDGGAINGTISAAGRYTLPAGWPANTAVVVRGRAADGSGRTGVAFVSLNPDRPAAPVPVGGFTFVH